MNKSTLFKLCKDNLYLMNNPNYYEAFFESVGDAVTFESAIEKKARYLTGDVAPIITGIKEIGDGVTTTGFFRCEVEIFLSEHGAVLEHWPHVVPKNIEEIVEKAFKVFDAMKNSETYPMDTLCYHIIISECVRRYFEEVWLLATETYANHDGFSIDY